MVAFAHSVTYAHRDWITLGAQIVAPLGSLLVSGIALFFSYQTAKQANRTADRQTKISEAKLVVDQFDRRYDAWKTLSDDAEGFFNYAMNLRAAEIQAEHLDPTPLNRVNISINRMFFLFGNEAYERTKDVHSALKELFRVQIDYRMTYVDRKGERLVEQKRSEVKRAIAEYEHAMDELRQAVRVEMSLPELPPPPAL